MDHCSNSTMDKTNEKNNNKKQTNKQTKNKQEILGKGETDFQSHYNIQLFSLEIR